MKLLLSISSLFFSNALFVGPSVVQNQVSTKTLMHPRQSLKIRNNLKPYHKKTQLRSKYKNRSRSSKLELSGYNEQQTWFITPLSTPAVLATLSQWVHEYPKNSIEANSIMEMMTWQEMVAIKDCPGFHLSIGLCCEHTIRAVAQFQSVHNDKKNLLLINDEEDILNVQPLTVRAIATSKDEDFAIDMLLEIFSNINNGPILLNGNKVLELDTDKYINFNWKRLKFVPKWFLDVIYYNGI